eukprot:GDKJ01058315.1.p1 GENE.GDKJ01058315.1~~GDKJ01058315.1.p1  ORF type:complete len:290 (+),score=75.15 GDKJ01058315.1:1-870(+)
MGTIFMFGRFVASLKPIHGARFFASSHKFVVSQSGGLPDLMRFAAADKRPLVPEGMEGASFGHIKECESSPVSKKILEINGVTGVVVSKQFMSVYKDIDASWSDISHLIEDVLDKTFENKELVVLTDVPATQDEVDITAGMSLEDLSDDEVDPELEEINKDIEELLEMRAKPIVKGDGGDLEFRGFDEQSGTVWIYFKGACESCSSSGVTLHQAIGQMLRHYLPEVTTIKRCDADGEPLDDDGAPDDDYSANPPALVARKKAQKKLLREKLLEKQKNGDGLAEKVNRRK